MPKPQTLVYNAHVVGCQTREVLHSHTHHHGALEHVGAAFKWAVFINLSFTVIEASGLCGLIRSVFFRMRFIILPMF